MRCFLLWKYLLHVPITFEKISLCRNNFKHFDVMRLDKCSGSKKISLKSNISTTGHSSCPISS